MKMEWKDEETELKMYKGFHIYREVKKYNGKIKDRWYQALDDNDGLLDAQPTLQKLKKVIDNYCG